VKYNAVQSIRGTSTGVISRLFGQQYVDVSPGQLGVHIVRVILHRKTTTDSLFIFSYLAQLNSMNLYYSNCRTAVTVTIYL